MRFILAALTATTVCTIVMYEVLFNMSFNDVVRNNNITEDEYRKLLNINDFRFKINTLPCIENEDDILLVVIVSSDPRNVDKRNAIRHTWGENTDNTKVVFLFGESMNTTISENIHIESDFFKDIVQGNFLDSYRNMTYKHIMGLKWVAHHCSNAKYVLKTDDDLFVNMGPLKNFLVEKLLPHKTRNKILCEVLVNVYVLRNISSKWMVTREEYPGDLYPNYCSGFAILYTNDVVPRLVRAAQNSPFFWVDDVYVTGILAEQLNILLEPFGTMILSPRRSNLLISIGPSYSGEFFFGTPGISGAGIVEFWKAVYHIA